MTFKLDSLIELLDKKNIETLRAGIVELILDRVYTDLYDLNVYLFDYMKLMDKIEEEVRTELKKRYIEALVPEIDAKFTEMMKGDKV